MKQISNREALKAEAYIKNILACLVPGDAKFDEIWNVIPEHMNFHSLLPFGELLQVEAKIKAILDADNE